MTPVSGKAMCAGYGMRDPMYVFQAAARRPAEHRHAARTRARASMRARALRQVPTRTSCKDAAVHGTLDAARCGPATTTPR